MCKYNKFAKFSLCVYKTWIYWGFLVQLFVFKFWFTDFYNLNRRESNQMKYYSVRRLFLILKIWFWKNLPTQELNLIFPDFIYEFKFMYEQLVSTIHPSIQIDVLRSYACFDVTGAWWWVSNTFLGVNNCMDLLLFKAFCFITWL